MRYTDGRVLPGCEAAQVLLLLGVPDVLVDAIMSWEPGSSARMRARYMHVNNSLLLKVAKQVGDILWGPEGDSGEGAADPERDGN
ncbi:hypothetical protein ABZ832_19035 [Streptantibioticus parmotrematis]|uniref:hypothetical protein n=1 Tax=Streptantibioticus parmotrematis TaxID=2873249 RepID=UPI0033F9858E